MQRDQEFNDAESCLNKAQWDEWIFVLRAKDPLAATVIRSWATAAEQEGLHGPEKIASARACADEMDLQRQSRW